MRNFNLAAVILFLFLFGANTSVISQEKSLTVTCQRNNQNGFDFNYKKTAEGSFFVIVKLNNVLNSLQTEFKHIVKASDYNGLLFSDNSTDKNSPISFSTYTTSYYRGIPNPKIDNSFVYALPYKPGNAFTVKYLSNLNEVYFGNLSTKNFKAFEFSSRVCDTVCAIRKGIVVKIVDKYQMDTTIAKSYTSEVNSILIEQPDGTLASYTGFRSGSIFVKEGQTVLPNTPLGTLAFYDSKKMHSLRLQIYFLSDKNIGKNDDEPVTLKTIKHVYEFINPLFFADKGVTKLDNNKSYKACFSEYILEHEMTKKELKVIGKNSKAPDDLPKNPSYGDILN